MNIWLIILIPIPYLIVALVVNYNRSKMNDAQCVNEFTELGFKKLQVRQSNVSEDKLFE